MRNGLGIPARILAAAVVAAAVLVTPVAPRHHAAAATCVGSVGPGIPAPTSVPSGIPGFHAQWYGQSGYPTLCPGARSTATVAYYNSGSLGWVSGKMGEVAYLGTWGPEPGQDQVSLLGGDGLSGSINTGWPSYNRIAIQPAAYVGPGQVAWFQFTIQAPLGAGTYRLYLRPLIEGATWLEDFGVFWLVTVLNADGTPPAPPVAGLGYTQQTVSTPVGQFSAHVIKERLSDVSVKTLTANAIDCFSACPAKPLAQYAAETGAYAALHGTYFCPPDYAPCADKVNSFDYAVWNSTLSRWINPRALVGTNSMMAFSGKTPRYFQRMNSYDRSGVSAAISNYPTLVLGGSVVDSTSEQSAVQMQRGTRGAIGADSTFVYLVIVSSASVTESAYVMRALGARDALNLDGGGSAAMWIGGSYKVGPGRQLPNAIVLTKP